MKEVKFEKYIKMIDKKAWEVSKKTGVDFEELQAQGALIYCFCLEKYDSTKANFSTILYLALNGLSQYTYYYNDRYRNEDLNETVEDTIEAKSDSVSARELLQVAKDELSRDAYRCLEWIIGRTWDFHGRLKPTLTMVISQFGWKRKYVEMVWNDCKSFWNRTGWALYC